MPDTQICSSLLMSRPAGRVITPGQFYSITMVPADLLPALWSHVSMWLMFGAMAGPKSEVNLAWMAPDAAAAIPELQDGRDQIWAVFGRTGCEGAFRTNITCTGDVRSVNAFDLGGLISLQTWFPVLEETLVAFARSQGCEVLRLSGGEFRGLTDTEARTQSYSVVGERLANPVFERALK